MQLMGGELRPSHVPCILPAADNRFSANSRHQFRLPRRHTHLPPTESPGAGPCDYRALQAKIAGLPAAAAGRQTGPVEILETLDLGRARVALRRAMASDVPAIVGLLAADQLGATRDGIGCAEDLAAYQAAFAAIDRDPAHLLIVAQSGQDIVATMQLSFLPGLARSCRPAGSDRGRPGPCGLPRSGGRSGSFARAD